jgi:hypothetical protein
MFSGPSKENTDKCHQVGEPWGHCAQWKKPDRRGHRPYESIHVTVQNRQLQGQTQVSGHWRLQRTVWQRVMTWWREVAVLHLVSGPQWLNYSWKGQSAHGTWIKSWFSTAVAQHIHELGWKGCRTQEMFSQVSFWCVLKDSPLKTMAT